MTTQRQMSAGVLLEPVFATHRVNICQSEHTTSCARIPHSSPCAGFTRIEDIPRGSLMINLTVLERIL